LMICASAIPIRPSTREVVSHACDLPSSKIAPAMLPSKHVHLKSLPGKKMPREFNAAVTIFLQKNHLLNRS